jgi:hypothetical protein
LENNLHPSIQRRLFLYIKKLAAEHGCHFFLTTHSNVVIDLFGRDPLAQILHVTHDGTSAKVETIKTYLHKHSVLKDLDVRASDLLQSNAVVWVEGPSDRIYFNRWIEVWDGELRENVHYQCLYTGGVLIEGMSFDGSEEAPQDPESENVDELIEALRINRHAIVMMDRDRDSEEPLKPWVGRIQSELSTLDGVPWVTAGRTVENYIPTDVFKKLKDGGKFTLNWEPGLYEDLFNCFKGPRGGTLLRQKPALARAVVPLLTKDNLTATYDLSKRLNAVSDKLRQWNGMPSRQGHDC